MKLSHIKLLKCIECGGPLALADDRPKALKEDSIETGVLGCLDCKESFPVVDTVGIFFKKEILPFFLNDHEKMACASLGIAIKECPGGLPEESLITKKVCDNWSYQWNDLSVWSKDDFDKDDLKGEECFKRFIRIRPEEYKGKRVVVWCGGNGREAYHIAKFKPELLIVNEIGDEIYRIKSLIHSEIDLFLLRCDMIYNPLRKAIADISICDHALQHVIDKPGAFLELANVLKAGGTAAVCVYSFENNFLMTGIIEPLKKTIHRWPLNFQRDISLVPAVIIFLLIKLFYLPAKYFLPEGICKKIPLFDHMIFWSKGNFALIKLSCFDLIHAPVSYHFKEDEVRLLANDAGLHVEKLINTHGTTWSMTATK